MSELKVSSLDDLKRAGEGLIVQLPNFPNGTPLVAKIKFPSLLSMIRTDGEISNPLMASVMELSPDQVAEKLANPNQQPADAKQIEDTLHMIDSICKECLVEPTYAQIEQYAGGLTDNQKIAIYNRVQEVFTGLGSFRPT